MTAILKQLWSRLNKMLTFVNVLLFNTEVLKKAQKKKIPLLPNILLLLFFGLALFAVIYK